jgi:hypothetical protein
LACIKGPFAMTNQLRHVADIKIGSVKGKSRVYPQLRLPSQYADLAGKKASLYEINDIGEEVAFIICFGTKNSLAAYYERAELEEGLKEPVKPCRGFQLLTSEAFLKHSWVTSGAE